MARIYVSSTFSDLEEHRAAVSKAIRRLGHDAVAMEDYVAQDKRPLDRCLEDVAACDIYLGIVAWRYGYVPQLDNPGALSVTELEYRRALELGKPCLLFVMSEDAPWPQSKTERDALESVDALREAWTSSDLHLVTFFETLDGLSREVTASVAKQATRSGWASQRLATDWDEYREAVLERHEWVRLQVIAGAGKNKDPVRIPLTDVFEPQLVVAGVPGTEVPDEVREYQRRIYRDHSSDPEGSNTEDAPDGAVVDEPVSPSFRESTSREGEPENEGDDALIAANREQVLNVLGRERTQVILGGPGSGKSTLVQYAMLRVCQQQDQEARATTTLVGGEAIPFLIELRTYVLENDPSFVEHIRKRADEFYGVTLDVEGIQQVLRADGQAVVFFDGLDEVFDPHRRRKVIDEFQAFARRFRTARIVVTSRIAGYDRTSLGLAGFEHYTLMPLTLTHIKSFAEQWYHYYTLEGTDRTPGGLVQRIVESPRLLDLAGNPMLLTMMAVIYKDRDLPVERWRLYDRCAQTLLEDWEVGKGFKDKDFGQVKDIATAQKSEILQRVSMYMLAHHQAGTELNAIAYEPLQTTMESYLTKSFNLSSGDAKPLAEAILQHLMERTYVLAGIGERIFGFVHRTFMEYFAALQCRADFNSKKSDFIWLNHEIFGARWGVPEWEEVLLLLIAMLHDQGTPIRDVIEHVRTADAPPGPPFHVAFAARCLGEAGAVLDHEHGQAVLAQLAGTIAEHAVQPRKEPSRKYVEAALGAFAWLAPLVTPPGAVEEALQTLRADGSVGARTSAWQMGFALRSRDERLAYALEALNDGEEAVRRGAVAALEREWPGRADIGPELANVVAHDRQARVRMTALASIERSWPHEPTILEAIEGRVDQETAYTYVIGVIGYLSAAWRRNPGARELVVALAAPKARASASYDQDAVVRFAAESLAVGWGGDTAALAFLQDRLAGESSPDTRGAVARAIATGWRDHEPALALLQQRAATDPDDEARTEVAQAIALGWAGQAHALAFMQGRLAEDPAPQTRAALAAAIMSGWRGLAEPLAILQARVDHEPDPQVRVALAQAMATGWFDEPEAVAFLRDRAIHDPDPGVRAETVRTIAFRAVRDPEGSAFLRDRAANDPVPATRAAILAALVDRPGYDYEPDHQELAYAALRTAFDDSAPDVRRAAVQLTQRMLDDRYGHFPSFTSYQHQAAAGLDLLTRAAQEDPDTVVRLSAISALAQTEGSRSFYFNSSSTNALATEVLMQSREFVVEQATSHPNELVRSLAVWSLADASRDDETLALLERRAVDDSSPAVRLEAVRAIAWTWGEWAGKGPVATYLRQRADQDPDRTTRDGARQVLVGLQQGMRTRATPLGETRHWAPSE